MRAELGEGLGAESEGRALRRWGRGGRDLGPRELWVLVRPAAFARLRCALLRPFELLEGWDRVGGRT